jgi:hypothetical protein
MLLLLTLSLHKQVSISIGSIVPVLSSPIKIYDDKFLIACLILSFQSLERIWRGSMVDNHLNLSMSTQLLRMFSTIYRVAQ